MIAIAPLAYLHLLYDEWKDNGVFWAAVLVHHRKKRRFLLNFFQRNRLIYFWFFQSFRFFEIVRPNGFTTAIAKFASSGNVLPQIDAIHFLSELEYSEMFTTTKVVQLQSWLIIRIRWKSTLILIIFIVRAVTLG